jgi:hypothetical protein
MTNTLDLNMVCHINYILNKDDEMVNEKRKEPCTILPLMKQWIHKFSRYFRF